MYIHVFLHPERGEMRIEEEIYQSKFESEELKAYINILYTAGWLNTRQTKFFKSFGISSQQYNVLRILRGQCPGPGSIQLLKERMIDRDCNVGRIIDKLEGKRFVERKTSEEDRRQVDIFITQKGLNLLDEIEVYISSEYAVMSRISSKDRMVLNSILDKVRG